MTIILFLLLLLPLIEISDSKAIFLIISFDVNFLCDLDLSVMLFHFGLCKSRCYRVIIVVLTNLNFPVFVKSLILKEVPYAK